MKGLGIRGVGLVPPAMQGGLFGKTFQGNGGFDAWITDQLIVEGVAPKTGSTGAFDDWITDQLIVDSFGSVT